MKEMKKKRETVHKNQVNIYLMSITYELVFFKPRFLYHNDCSVAIFTLILDTLGGNLTLINPNMCSYALNIHHVLTIP